MVYLPLPNMHLTVWRSSLTVCSVSLMFIDFSVSIVSLMIGVNSFRKLNISAIPPSDVSARGLFACEVLWDWVLLTQADVA